MRCRVGGFANELEWLCEGGVVRVLCHADVLSSPLCTTSFHFHHALHTFLTFLPAPFSYQPIWSGNVRPSSSKKLRGPSEPTGAHAATQFLSLKRRSRQGRCVSSRGRGQRKPASRRTSRVSRRRRSRVRGRPCRLERPIRSLESQGLRFTSTSQAAPFRQGLDVACQGG